MVDEAAFEIDLIRCLARSPVAVTIKVYHPSLDNLIGNQIYRPLHSERYQATPFRHDMLLVKSDIDEYGIPYWESNGEGGYIRITKKVTVWLESL